MSLYHCPHIQNVHPNVTMSIICHFVSVINHIHERPEVQLPRALFCHCNLLCQCLSMYPAAVPPIDVTICQYQNVIKCLCPLPSVSSCQWSMLPFVAAHSTEVVMYHCHYLELPFMLTVIQCVLPYSQCMCNCLGHFDHLWHLASVFIPQTQR